MKQRSNRLFTVTIPQEAIGVNELIRSDFLRVHAFYHYCSFFSSNGFLFICFHVTLNQGYNRFMLKQVFFYGSKGYESC
ncbi:uncharacterized protein LOC110917076 isoform X2 [Helianthus annuus]|uniref:uncharacterized protein LOC110917076 isoform X2 n=1 Tax=Helianthus annuus TaxID=4232 RepID=UPI000B906D6E|nr:uncharacterized protein LOC110917076 isoform X2 [Helianthus annuus]